MIEDRCNGTPNVIDRLATRVEKLESALRDARSVLVVFQNCTELDERGLSSTEINEIDAALDKIKEVLE